MVLQSVTLLCHFKEGSDDFNQGRVITRISSINDGTYYFQIQSSGKYIMIF